MTKEHLKCLTEIGKILFHKGVTIGMENIGKRKGYPKIDDDVLIAPNSYVNCDVPSHSIVFGNLCVIKRCENTTESYNNKI